MNKRNNKIIINAVTMFPWQGLLKIGVRATKVANIDDTDKKLPDGVI